MDAKVEFDGKVLSAFRLGDLSKEEVRKLLVFCGSKLLADPKKEHYFQFEEWYHHHVDSKGQQVIDVYDEKGYDKGYWRGGFAFSNIKVGETIFYTEENPPMLVSADGLNRKHPNSVKIIE